MINPHWCEIVLMLICTTIYFGIFITKVYRCDIAFSMVWFGYFFANCGLIYAEYKGL